MASAQPSPVEVKNSIKLYMKNWVWLYMKISLKRG